MQVAEAEKDTLINWEKVLCKCPSSLEYSQSFVNNAIQQSNETVTTANQLRQTLSETSDMINGDDSYKLVTDDNMYTEPLDG